jgi:hypothetical protein
MDSQGQQLFPLGTKINKQIKDGHDDSVIVVVGEVKAYQDGLYSIFYTDGDTEQWDEREMKRYLSSNPSGPRVRRRCRRNTVATSVATPGVSSRSTSRSKQHPPPQQEQQQKEQQVLVEKQQQQQQQEDDDDDDIDAQRRERMMRDIELMHQELEVTGYARSKSGHKKRVVPRHLSKIRTKKRKMLEKKDAAERAVLREEEEEEGNEIVDDQPEKDGEGDDTKEPGQTGGGFATIRPRTWKRRLRGSKAALDDDVLQGSMIFQPPPTGPTKKDLMDEEGDDDKDDDDNNNIDDDDDDDDDDEEDLSVEGDDDSEDGEDGLATTTAKQVAKTGSKKGASKKPSPHKKKKSSSVVSQTVKKRRRMYRLRNFQSFRMAQRHGDALAAHARGDHKLAIEKLKAVAKDAPSAPQVYSSLGMVYEDMLKESKEKYYERKANGDPAATIIDEGSLMNPASADRSSGATPFVPNQLLREQCDLAKKAYGSHHVSAILCKKDFTLWVRAGDSALEIAYVKYPLGCFFHSLFLSLSLVNVIENILS